MDLSLVAPKLRHMVRGNRSKLLEYRWGRRLARSLIKFVPQATMEGVTIEPLTGDPPLRIYRPAAQRNDACLLGFTAVATCSGRRVPMI